MYACSLLIFNMLLFCFLVNAEVAPHVLLLSAIIASSKLLRMIGCCINGTMGSIHHII